MKNSLLLALLLPVFGLACSDKSTTEDSSEPDTTDGGTTDGGTTDGGTDSGTTDGGTDSGTDSGANDSGATDGCDTGCDTGDSGTTDGGTTTPFEFPAEGVEIVSIDKVNWADVDYEMVTLEITKDAFDYYDSLFDSQNATFYLWRPAVETDEKIPLLVWFHGAAVGDDTLAEEGAGALPQPCSELRITGGTIETNLEGPSMSPKMAAYRGWAMVMPRNDWCDAWIGWGPDDPVDPERHYGYYHAARSIDWLRGGHGGFRVDDDAIYAWGTSSGATGAMIAASRYEEIDAVIFDSGVSSYLTYYERAGKDFGTNTSEVVHIFGGDPYDKAGAPNGEVYDRYVEASPALMIQDEGFRKPIFISWNNYDQNLGIEHASEMINAVATSYGSDRWFETDLDHLYPSPRGHVQTIYGQLPLGYLPWTAMEFLGGSHVEILEAEDGCVVSPCNVGVSVTGDDDSTYESFSGGGGRRAIPSETGVLYSGRLPEGVSDGDSVRASMAIKAYGHNLLTKDAIIGRLVYLEGGVEVASKNYIAGIMAPDGTGGPPEDIQVLEQYNSTWMEFTVTDASSGELRFEHTGVNENRIDTAIFVF